MTSGFNMSWIDLLDRAVKAEAALALVTSAAKDLLDELEENNCDEDVAGYMTTLRDAMCPRSTSATTVDPVKP